MLVSERKFTSIYMKENIRNITIFVQNPTSGGSLREDIAGDITVLITTLYE